jgi:deoxyhypusine monooxygenase
LFTLRNLGGPKAVEGISSCFTDSSALLKHELAYCLGQMQDPTAIPVLTSVLKDVQQEPMVRHEAGNNANVTFFSPIKTLTTNIFNSGEALGAIGSAESLPVLQEHCEDKITEVAETCQLAVQRINWLLDEKKKSEIDSAYQQNPYCSVDPTPSTSVKETGELKTILLDETLPLFERYRAMFALRNKGDVESVKALAEGIAHREIC